MTPRINAVLASIREDLSNQEPAWGPELPPPSQDGFQSGKPGVGGAQNVSDGTDALDDYLYGLAKTIADEFEMSVDDALEFIFDAAEELEGMGLISGVPADEASAAEAARWLGTAATIGFSAQVLKAARANLDADEDEAAGAGAGE